MASVAMAADGQPSGHKWAYGKNAPNGAHVSLFEYYSPAGPVQGFAPDHIEWYDNNGSFVLQGFHESTPLVTYPEGTTWTGPHYFIEDEMDWIYNDPTAQDLQLMACPICQTVAMNYAYKTFTCVRCGKKVVGWKHTDSHINFEITSEDMVCSEPINGPDLITCECPMCYMSYDLTNIGDEYLPPIFAIPYRAQGVETDYVWCKEDTQPIRVVLNPDNNLTVKNVFLWACLAGDYTHQVTDQLFPVEFDGTTFYAKCNIDLIDGGAGNDTYMGFQYTVVVEDPNGHETWIPVLVGNFDHTSPSAPTYTLD